MRCTPGNRQFGPKWHGHAPPQNRHRIRRDSPQQAVINLRHSRQCRPAGWCDAFLQISGELVIRFGLLDKLFEQCFKSLAGLVGLNRLQCHTRLSQLIHRQIQSATQGIFSQITQDIRNLQSHPAMNRQ